MGGFAVEYTGHGSHKVAQQQLDEALSGVAAGGWGPSGPLSFPTQHTHMHHPPPPRKNKHSRQELNAAPSAPPPAVLPTPSPL